MRHKKRSLRKERNRQESVGYEGAEFLERSQWNFAVPSASYPLFPFLLEETIRRNRFRFRESYCRFFYAVLLLEGRLRYRYNDRTFILEPGSLLLIPPGCDYGFDSETTGTYHKLVLELNGLHLNSMCTAFGLDHFQILPLEDAESMRTFFYSVRDRLAAADVSDVPSLLGESYAFLARISEWSRKKNPLPDPLFQAQKLLESRSEPNVEISEIARRLGIGVSSLNRLFRNRLKISPVQYRNGCRIEQARDLLTRSSLSVKEIAAELGFCNQFYFCQLFRELNGCPPSIYRRRMRVSEV